VRLWYNDLIAPITPLLFLGQLVALLLATRWVYARLDLWFEVAGSGIAIAFATNLILYSIWGHRFAKYLPRDEEELLPLVGSLLGIASLSALLGTILLAVLSGLSQPIQIAVLRSNLLSFALSFVVALFAGFAIGAIVGVFINQACHRVFSGRWR
jgi:hypothetical protein